MHSFIHSVIGLGLQVLNSDHISLNLLCSCEIIMLLYNMLDLQQEHDDLSPASLSSLAHCKNVCFRDGVLSSVALGLGWLVVVAG